MHCVQCGYDFLSKTQEREIGRSVVHMSVFSNLDNRVGRFWLPSGIAVEVCCVTRVPSLLQFLGFFDILFPVRFCL